MGKNTQPQTSCFPWSSSISPRIKGLPCIALQIHRPARCWLVHSAHSEEPFIFIIFIFMHTYTQPPIPDVRSAPSPAHHSMRVSFIYPGISWAS